jgi:hypothetical protein
MVTHTLFMYRDALLELMNVSMWSNIRREWVQNSHTYTVYINSRRASLYIHSVCVTILYPLLPNV